MNKITAAIRSNRSTMGSSFAIDTTVDFPLDYYLLSEIVEELAVDLAKRHTRARPVAVKLENGLTQALLDLALLEANIPQLCLPRLLTAARTASALRTYGAQALYEGTPCHGVPVIGGFDVLLPRDTAWITIANEPMANPNGVSHSADRMFAVAEIVARSVKIGHGVRHLTLLSPACPIEPMFGLYATILAGGTYVVPPLEMVGLANPFCPDFALMVKKIAEWRITSLMLTPDLYGGLALAMEKSGEQLALLTLVGEAGTRLTSLPIVTAQPVKSHFVTHTDKKPLERCLEHLGPTRH